jgi:hypothetical protein
MDILISKVNEFFSSSLIIIIQKISFKQESSQNQGLCFYLGRNEICDKNNQNMASIYMVQRDSNNVTQYSTINEWFEYAHHGIDAVGLRNFPVFKEDTELKNDMRKKIKVNEKIKYEEIFHLPRLEIFYNSLIVKGIKLEYLIVFKIMFCFL